MLNDYIHKKEQMGTAMKNIDEVIKLKRWTSWTVTIIRGFVTEDQITVNVGDHVSHTPLVLPRLVETLQFSFSRPDNPNFTFSHSIFQKACHGFLWEPSQKSLEVLFAIPGTCMGRVISTAILNH